MKKIIRLTESDLTRIIKRVINEEQCLKPPQWLLDYEIDSNKFKAACNQYYMGINVNPADETKIGMVIQIELETKSVLLDFWRINLVNNLGVDNLKTALGGKFTDSMGRFDVGPNRNRFEFTFEDDTDLLTKLNAIKNQFESLTYINETDLTRLVKRIIREMEDDIDDSVYSDDDPFKGYKNQIISFLNHNGKRPKTDDDIFDGLRELKYDDDEYNRRKATMFIRRLSGR